MIHKADPGNLMYAHINLMWLPLVGCVGTPIIALCKALENEVPFWTLMDAITREFIKDCRSAGLTSDDEWSMASDIQLELQNILVKYREYIQLILNSQTRFDPKHGLKPLIWHIFRFALRYE